MTSTNEKKTGWGDIAGIILILSIFPFSYFVAFPFFESLTAESQLEKFISEQCLEGNEIAICIKRDHRCFKKTEYNLVRAAIEGNEHAAKALRIDPKSPKSLLF